MPRAMPKGGGNQSRTHPVDRARGQTALVSVTPATPGERCAGPMVVMVETQASGQSPAIPLQETPSDTPGLDATVILGSGNGPTAALAQRHTVAGRLWFWQEWTATPGSHNSCYVTWANSPALIIRLVWQSSLATLPFGHHFTPEPFLRQRYGSAQGARNGRLYSKVCHP